MRKFINKGIIIPIGILFIYVLILSIFQLSYIGVKISIWKIIILGIISGISSIFSIKILSKIFSKIQIKKEEQKKMPIGRIVACVTFIILMIYFIGQYPGGASPDTINQYAQAIGDKQYSDWHPVLHTLLFFTIPLKIIPNFGFVVFLQLLYFSIAFGYLIHVLNKNGCPIIAQIILCCFVWFNPILVTNLMYPWKDVALTIFLTVCVAQYIQIVVSKGEWLRDSKNMFLFCIVMVFSTYMRHNAILFTIPLLLIVLFYVLSDKMMRLRVASLVIAGFVLIKLLYAVMDVEKPDRRIVETIGLPATIWCNVMKKNNDALPIETQNIMYEFATQEMYEEYYTTGNFNSIKWPRKIDIYKIDSLSYTDVIKYTWECFKYAPKESYEALVRLTNLVWGINSQGVPEQVGIIENDYGIESMPNRTLNNMFEVFRRVGSNQIIRMLFGSIGLMFFIILVIGCSLLANGRTAIIHILPIFFYNFGTMLLLSGPDYRFFLFNPVLWFAIIFLMLKDEKKIKY